jgi:hypothetical protein
MEILKKVLEVKIEKICDADKRNKEEITSNLTIADALKVLGGATTVTAVFVGGYAIGIEIAFECLRIRGLM